MKNIAEKFPLKKDESDPKKLFRRIYLPKIKIKYCCGSLFEGTYIDGKRNGTGKLNLHTGDYFEGDFRDGLRNGVGSMSFFNYSEINGIYYEGDYKNDLRHGYGTYECSDGTEFFGRWKRGLQSYGTFEGKNGHKYMGYWNGKKMDQEGVFLDPDGKVYKGEISNDVFKGRGSLKIGAKVFHGDFEGQNVNKEGKIENQIFEYEGQILNNVPHGYGTKKFINGNVYKGYWKNGFEEGDGLLEFENKDSYRGNFKRGKFSGYGVYCTFDGEKYEGFWKNGVRHGKGTILFVSGIEKKKEKYEGQFLNGVACGIGTLFFKNGDVYKGEFRDGKIFGKGKLTTFRSKNEGDEQEVYEGEFENDLLDGYGCYMQGNKEVYLGFWRKGKRHGKGQYLDENGDYAMALFCDDKILDDLLIV